MVCTYRESIRLAEEKKGEERETFLMGAGPGRPVLHVYV
jgi:hypothetical protein